jgi:hypothetical protein
MWVILCLCVCVCAHECVDVYACVCVCKQYWMYQWIDLIFQWSCVALSGPWGWTKTEDKRQKVNWWKPNRIPPDSFGLNDAQLKGWCTSRRFLYLIRCPRSPSNKAPSPELCRHGMWWADNQLLEIDKSTAPFQSLNTLSVFFITVVIDSSDGPTCYALLF